MCPSLRPSVRPYVRPSVHKKFFSDFDLIWCVGRPRPDMRTRVTSTGLKVKVKVTELLKLRKLHFSSSSAIFAWSSKLMVGYDSMDLVYSITKPDFPFSFQESYHVSSNFAECRYFTKFKWPYFRTA